MALTAECTTDIITINAGDDRYSFPRDGIYKVVVNYGGLLSASTLSITKCHPNGELDLIVIPGTGGECQGLHDAILSFMRGIFGGTPYADWTYP
jgi:hypothetical protein